MADETTATTTGTDTTTTTTDTGAGTPTVSDWTATLDADALGYVQSKGFKGPGDVLTSYRNLERVVGAPPESIIKLPKDDSPEAWSQVYDRLGRPKEAKDYSVTVPEGQDPKFADTAKGWFHEAGLSAKQASAIVEKWNAHAAELQKANQTAYEASVVEDTNKLKLEWGGKYDENVALAKKAANAFGLDAPTIDRIETALGHAGLVKLFHNIGSKMGVEDQHLLGNGKPGFAGMTVEQARARRNELMTDKAFGARYKQGDADARREIETLNRIIAPGEMTI